MSLLSTKEVATRLGISVRRVQGLIKEGILPAQKIGRDYVVEEAHVKLAARRNPRGRPAKAETARRAAEKSTRRKN